MNGLDCLREELKGRGLSQTQIESKAVAVVLDIVSNSGDKYTKMWKEEHGITQKLKDLQNYLYSVNKEVEFERGLIVKLENERKEALNHRNHCEDYIDDFNNSLKQCETKEGRDAMRIAQMFVNTVNVDTKYDNTAFIIGLATILSKGEINGIKELAKINKKLPQFEECIII